MPPVSRSVIMQAQVELGVPLFAHAETGQDSIEVAENDIRTALLSRVGTLSVETALDGSLRTHLHALYNLETYIYDAEAGMEESELREHQRDVFHAIYNFIACPPTADDGSSRVTRGYIHLPTGSGKTAIFSTLVDVINKPIALEGKPLKALVLVPKLDLVDQTVGRDGERGFARFAQNTAVSTYTGNHKDLSGDAVVMTYQSLIHGVAKGKISADMFDLVICDEAHRALGESTKTALETIVADKIVLGFTATANYAVNKQVKDILPHLIHEMNVREAIQLGYLAPVQCFAVTSEAELSKLGSQSKDYTVEELSKLIQDEWRNLKAVQFAKSFVEAGKQGLISCVPGNETEHPKIVADALNHTYVTDPSTGSERLIKAVAVDGSMSNNDRLAIYQSYESGDIDVLTFVDLLMEGWDSDCAKFLINLRPTVSPVVAEQRLGRILRIGQSQELATIVEFIDKSDRQQILAHQILGAEDIVQGKIYRSKDKSVRESTERQKSEIVLPFELLQELGKINHILIRELIVQPDVKPAEEILSENKLAKRHGIHFRTMQKLVAILRDQGEVFDDYRFGSKMAPGLRPDQQDKLLALPDAQKVIGALPGEDGISFSGFAKKYDAPPDKVAAARQALIDEGIVFYSFRFGSKINDGLTVEHEQLMVEKLADIITMPRSGSTFHSIKAVANELGVTVSSVHRTLEDLKAEGHAFPDIRHRTTYGPGITSEQKELIKDLVSTKMPDDQTSHIMFAKSNGRHVKTVLRAIDQLRDQGVDFKEYRSGGKKAIGLTADIQTRILNIIISPSVNPQPGILSLEQFAEKHELNANTVRKYAKILQASGTELGQYGFGKAKTKGTGVDDTQEQLLLDLIHAALNRR